jgi:hypothetical protein
MRASLGLSPPLHGRGESLPEVPSVAESGYDHYGEDFWLGLFAPAKTSKETISPTRPSVQCGSLGARGQGACSPGALSSRDMQRGLCRASSKII